MKQCSLLVMSLFFCACAAVGLENLTIEAFQSMGAKTPKSLTPVKTAGGGMKAPPLIAAKTGPAVLTPPVSSASAGIT